MIDSVGDVGAALTQAEPQSLTALYEALRVTWSTTPSPAPWT